MKYWIALLCLAGECACAAPRISVTQSSQRSVVLLVQDAQSMPMQEVDAEASGHCRQYGRSARRAGVAWTGPNSKQISYVCDDDRSPRKAEIKIRRPPPRRHGTIPATASVKSQAWQEAKAATEAWATCVRLEAERAAKETRVDLQPIVQAVMNACTELERAVHRPLEAVGEDSSRLRMDLHAQAVQAIMDTAVAVKSQAEAAVPGPLAAHDKMPIER